MVGEVREESGGGRTAEKSRGEQQWENLEACTVLQAGLGGVRDARDPLLRQPTSALPFHCSVVAAPLPHSCLKVRCDPPEAQCRLCIA